MEADQAILVIFVLHRDADAFITSILDDLGFILAVIAKQLQVISILKTHHFLLQSSDLIAYLKEQLDSKEKELFVVVSKEVEEKQLWMQQYAMQQSKPSDQPHHNQLSQCDGSVDSLSSNSPNDYRNRDAECLTLNEVRNCTYNRDDNY